MWRYCICDNCIHVHYRAFGIGVLHHPISRAFFRTKKKVIDLAEMHYFDVKIATDYGVNCAVVLQNILHWLKKNEANGKHFHDGSYWTYNSTKAFSELFPYLTQKQIETALKKLRDDGIIKTGNYNEMKYDRTLWYALTQKGECILLGKEMDTPPNGNGSNPEGEPIPDINPDVKPKSVNTDKKKASKNSFDAIIAAYTTDEKIVELLQEWLKVRKAKRAAMTDRAIQMNIDKLDKLAAESHMSVTEYLSEVICRGWAAFYAITNYSRQAKTYGANGIAIENKPSELDGIL